MSRTRYVTPARYRQWLQAQDSEAVIGLSLDSLSCPLQTWLLTTHPEGCDRVDVLSWVDAWNVRHRLPPWARRHVQVIDDSLCWEITATQALACLKAGQTS